MMNSVKDQPDFYWEGDLIVFTEAYHLKRGYCCNSGCRHCPYRSKIRSIKKKVTISWSGGKDSAFALYKIFASREYEVVGLHTIIDEKTKRVGLHGVSETLIERQADAIGLPLKKLYVPSSEESQAYENCMQQFYDNCRVENIQGIVFGDIFLEDLKQYRLNLLRPYQLFALFPLWGMNTHALVKDFIDAGFQSMVCAANASLLRAEEMGVIINDRFLASLSPHVDPCGEKGEFHSFVFDGPIFNKAVVPHMGDVVEKTYTYGKTNERGESENVESTFFFLDLS